MGFFDRIFRKKGLQTNITGYNAELQPELAKPSKVPFDTSGGFFSLPSASKFNYAEAVGNSLENSAVAACLNWITRTFPEAQLIVQQRDDSFDSTSVDNRNDLVKPSTRAERRFNKPKDKTGGKKRKSGSNVYLTEYDHPLSKLIRNPNPFYGEVTLWMGTLVSYTLSGNAYWLKIRNELGKVIQIYYLPDTMVEPKWPKNGSSFLSHYEYRPGDGKVYNLDPRDVVHFRNGMDPKNTRKGLSPLASLMREIFTDNEATSFGASLLRNMGVPGVIISPAADDTVIDPETADNIKQNFKAKFGGENRGEPMVMSAGVRINPVSLNPQQLDLKMLHRLPEERVSAVLGIPAIVAGLGAGLERSTMANFKEAREMAYESNIIPTQRVIARELEHQMLHEFESDITGWRLTFDLSEVRVLQDDQNVKFQRLDIAVRGGWMKRSEARAAVGLPVDEVEDELYLSGGNGGLDEFGLPRLANSAAFNNAEALRVAHNNVQNSGSAGTPPQGNRQQRGPHGRFMDVPNVGNDAVKPNDGGAAADNGGLAPNQTDPKKKKSLEAVIRYATVAYKGREVDLQTSIRSLVEVSDIELGIAEKFSELYAGEMAAYPSESEIAAALEAIIEAATNQMNLDSDELVETINTEPQHLHETALTKWATALMVWSKVAHLNAVAWAKGSWELAEEDFNQVKQSAFVDFQSLKATVHEISSGKPQLSADFIRYSQLYAKSAWNTFYRLPVRKD